METITLLPLIAILLLSLGVTFLGMVYIFVWAQAPAAIRVSRGPVPLRILWMSSKVVMVVVGIATSGHTILLLTGAEKADTATVWFRLGVWISLILSLLLVASTSFMVHPAIVASGCPTTLVVGFIL